MGRAVFTASTRVAVGTAATDLVTIKTEGAPNASLFWFSIRWFET